MHEIDRLGISRVMEQAIEVAAKGTDGVHLSLDLDGLDPKEAPGVGTPVPAGIGLRESLLAMEILADAGVVTSAEFVEVNPTLDTRNETAKIAVELIASLLGERIL
jgi:arginase